MRIVLAVLVVSMVIVGVASGAGRDPLTGTWVAFDAAGDQSTDRFVYGGPAANGVRNFTLIDSYGSFCETAGAGTGSQLVVKGTAVLVGNQVTSTVLSWTCANRSPGKSNITGIELKATLTADGLNDNYYVAHRAPS